MARKSFNWSLLDRNSLYSMLYKAGKHLIGKKLLVDDVHSLLSKHIKSHLPVKVKQVKGVVAQEGLMYMGGTYYSEYDENNQRQVEVVFSYNMFDEHLTVTRYRWQRMCILFADTILHEIIHMRQYRARGFKTLPGYESTAHFAKQRRDQEYYGDRDEMGAFSFNIACELIDRFGFDLDTISEYINSNQAKNHKRTSYYRYLKAFEFDHNHKIMKKIKRKILSQLPYAHAGKPFRTPDHLTY